MAAAIAVAWEISRTQESGGLESMGLQRVGHNSVTKPMREKETKQLLNNHCALSWIRSLYQDHLQRKVETLRLF